LTSTADGRKRTEDSRPCTADSRKRTEDSGRCTADSRMRTEESGQCKASGEQRAADIGKKQRTADSGQGLCNKQRTTDAVEDSREYLLRIVDSRPCTYSVLWTADNRG
jgi:hypothetical protein